MKKYNNSEESLKSHDSRDHVMIPFYLFLLRFFLFHLALFFFFILLRVSAEKLFSRTDFLRDETQSVSSLLTLTCFSTKVLALSRFLPLYTFLSLSFLPSLRFYARERTDSSYEQANESIMLAHSLSHTHTLSLTLAFTFCFVFVHFYLSRDRRTDWKNRRTKRKEEKKKRSAAHVRKMFSICYMPHPQPQKFT